MRIRRLVRPGPKGRFIAAGLGLILPWLYLVSCGEGLAIKRGEWCVCLIRGGIEVDTSAGGPLPHFKDGMTRTTPLEKWPRLRLETGAMAFSGRWGAFVHGRRSFIPAWPLVVPVTIWAAWV